MYAADMDQRADPSVNGKAPQGIAVIAGHFGELVQGRLGRDGPVALVTLPCPALATEVRFTPTCRALEIRGAEAPQAAALARYLLADWAPGTGGLLEIRRAAPPGAGAGSSTADLLGTLRAIAATFGQLPTPEEEAALCHLIEGAVDPLMYPENVLFASRTGQVVRRLPSLPRIRMVGGFAGPGARTDPADTAFPDMRETFAALEEALVTGDLAMLAAAVRCSAGANQHRNPNPAWAAVSDLAPRLGALGPAVSHTGSAIGLLFSPDTPTAAAEKALWALGLQQVLSFTPQDPV